MHKSYWLDYIVDWQSRTYYYLNDISSIVSHKFISYISKMTDSLTSSEYKTDPDGPLVCDNTTILQTTEYKVS